MFVAMKIYIHLTEILLLVSVVQLSLKQQYFILQLKMTLEKLSKRSASLRSISLALIFMLKMFSSRIFSLPTFSTVLLLSGKEDNVCHSVCFD